MTDLNLIIDGNYLLMRAVFILQKIKTLREDLETLLLKDYNNISNAYPYKVIYFISDSKKNWRKDIYSDYKGKRTKDTDIDWNFVFKTFDNFKEKIKSRFNCLLYQIDPFEGDDIIAHIINETNKEGVSNLILSNDSDIYQLLKYNTVDNYMNFMYNHRFQDERIYVPENYNIFLKHIEDNTVVDIFDLNDDSDFIEFFNNFSKKSKIITINKEEEYFKKLIVGDVGDNIKGVVKINNETKGVGKKGCQVVYSMFKEKYPNDIDFDSDTFVDNLTDILSIYKKNKDNNFKNSITENIKFSRKLTRLDIKYIPIEYQNILFENIKI